MAESVQRKEGRQKHCESGNASLLKYIDKNLKNMKVLAVKCAFKYFFKFYVYAFIK